MTATILRPILPWAGALEEDLRFRRVLILVLAIFSAAGAILPYLPLPLIEADFSSSDLPLSVRLITRPVTLYAPSSEPRQPVAPQSPLILVPHQERAAEVPAPKATKHSTPPPALDRTAQPKPESQKANAIS